MVYRFCGKMGNLTESQRGMIVGARLVGASAATVANVVGVSKGTVSNVMRAYSMLGKRNVVCPYIVYVLMTLDTVPFDTPTMFATVAAEATTRRAPMIMPLWDSVESPILPQNLHKTILTAEILTAVGS
ncbi:hypothetical protein C0J52_22122 [Blattella germanica]|nr:hypothetical protein C0J52_22122 [Blattella germanica]